LKETGFGFLVTIFNQGRNGVPCNRKAVAEETLTEISGY